VAQMPILGTRYGVGSTSPITSWGCPKAVGRALGAQACPFGQLILRQAQDDPEQSRTDQGPEPIEGLRRFSESATSLRSASARQARSRP
jgi:hypothetical protein